MSSAFEEKEQRAKIDRAFSDLNTSFTRLAKGARGLGTSSKQESTLQTGIDAGRIVRVVCKAERTPAFTAQYRCGPCLSPHCLAFLTPYLSVPSGRTL